MVALLLGFSFVATEGTGQNSTIIGVVRGNDMTNAAPQNWVVSITARIGASTTDHLSLQELYAIVVPAGTQGMSLTFAAEGYLLLEKAVPAASGRALLREDVELRRPQLAAAISGGSAPSADSVQLELEQQGAIARRAGPAARDVFEWNLRQYEAESARRPELNGPIARFKSSEAYRDIQRDRPATASRAQESIQRLQAGETASPNTRDLMSFLRERQALPSMQADAVTLLATTASPIERNELAEFVRKRMTEPTLHPVLARSYAEALARIGTADDKRTLLRQVESNDALAAAASLNGLASVRGPEVDSALRHAAINSTHPRIRVEALKTLTQTQASEAITSAIDQLGSDASATVRLQAVRVLGRINIPPNRLAEVKAALRRAAGGDVSSEVREEAQHILERR
jgi:hypothetical protein